MVRSGHGSWREVKEEAHLDGCLPPEVHCDCVQQRAIIQAMLEAMAMATAILGLVLPALLVLAGIRSKLLLGLVRVLLGNKAVDVLENMGDTVRQLRDLRDAQSPFLEMEFNTRTGLWEKVPELGPHINIRG
jgi:hypothetical protein